jgi:two-component system phosphate regulon sensor histidine kinase PhoR
MKKIFFKIFGGFVLLILILSALFLVFSFSAIRSHYQKTTAQELEILGREMSHEILAYLEKGENGELDAFLKRIGKDIHARVTVIDPQGNVMADSEKNPLAMENHRYRPEVYQALEGRVGQSLRFSYTVEEQMLYVGLPLENKGKILAVLRLSLVLKDIQALIRHIRTTIFRSVLFTAGLALLAAFLFSLHLTGPVKRLQIASRQVAAGNFETKVRIRNKDEFRELGESFNWMTDRISRLFADLSGKNEELMNILASIHEGLVVLDKEGKIVLANDAFKKLFFDASLEGKYVWEILRKPQIQEMISRVRAEKTSLSEECRFKDKSFLCTIGYLSQQDGIVLTMNDLTPHHC